MIVKRSKASLNRELKRNSHETIEFKNQINYFLQGKPDFLNYSIKRDLAIMTNMPFYKDRPKVVKIKLTRPELLTKWMYTFVTHDNIDFIVKLVILGQ